MDVIFQPSGGNPFCMEVGYFDTVLEIKEKIEKNHGIPISKQTLLFNDHILQDQLNIHQSDILDRSRVHLIVASDKNHQNHVLKTENSSSSKIQLLLKMPSSKLGIALEIDSHDTIRKLKEKIQEMEGIPMNQLSLHAKGVELQDHRSIHECELWDNAKIEAVVRSSPAPTTSSGSSGGTGGGGSRKLKIVVITKCGTKKIPLEVNLTDNVGELKKMLQIIKEQVQLDLPEEGYFFIYKQNVMDDDRSFRWHHVGQGDTIEIFGGSVTGGS